MIAVAKTRNEDLPNAEFYVNDGLTLDILESNLCDIIYCELVFLHVKKNVTRSYINEVHRVLKPNGVFYAQLPRREFYHDASVAYTKVEVDKLFAIFKYAEHMPFRSHPLESQLNAYYIVKAVK